MAPLDASDQQAVVDSYHIFRNALNETKQYLDRQPFDYYAGYVDSDAGEAALAELAALSVPKGLPLEFMYYLEGAIAYYEGDPAAARAHWQALLAGYWNAEQSLKMTAREAWKHSDDQALVALLNDRSARAVLTAYLLTECWGERADLYRMRLRNALPSPKELSSYV